jgi:hypothetical protein
MIGTMTSQGIAAVLAAEGSGTLGGSALASWAPINTLLIVYVVVVALLWWRGGPAEGERWPFGALQRIGRGLTRTTGIPGWAAVAIGQSLFALLVAGVGFYSDVAWHIALGRDEELFTAPHAGILLGLVGILSAAVFGTIVATLDGWEQGWRIGGLRVPWSMLPLAALGVGAVSGFPMDEIWHQAFGVDVTMWSPTHMLMIMGASFTGLAGWLVLADTGIKPSHSRWAAFLHGLAAWLTLQGLVASQGEFSFGVPQFAQVFQPMLISLAAGLGLVAIRLVLGPGRALLITVIFAITQMADIGPDSGPVETRHGATFLVSALVVEVLARLVGTADRVRFAVTAGIGIGTVGLAGEWVWNTGAHQAWNTSLLPYAVATSVLTAVGGALLGAGFTGAFAFAVPGRRIGAAALAVGVLLAAVPALWFLPRDTDDVTADITLEEVGTTTFGVEQVEAEGAIVTVELTPADAADDAHWFQTTSWQGGGLVVEEMVEIDRGLWRSEAPVPIDGLWKTLVRLHRNGSELMAAPIWFPDDREIGEPEIAAVDRTIAFGPETQYLLRETEEGDLPWLPPIVHGYLGLTVVGWLLAFVIGVRRIGGAGELTEEEPPQGTGPARARPVTAGAGQGRRTASE